MTDPHQFPPRPSYPPPTTEPTTIPPLDTPAVFHHIPWIARLLHRPNTIIRVPGARRPLTPGSSEDSLFAATFKTATTVRSCVVLYQERGTDGNQPREDGEDEPPEATILVDVGDGMNGHHNLLHGGALAALIDESMGIYMNVIQERATLQQLQLQPGLGEKPPPSPPDHFTASLKVDYLRPVRAPGAMAITVRREREEGRKVWLRAEVRQGEEVVCAKGEALWIGVVVGRGKL